MDVYGFVHLQTSANPVLRANAYNHHILWPISSWQSHPQRYCISDAVCCTLGVGPRPRLVPQFHTEVTTTETEAQLAQVGQHRTEAPELLVMDPSRMRNIASQNGWMSLVTLMCYLRWHPTNETPSMQK